MCVLLERQHHPNGNSIIENGVTMHYNWPNGSDTQTWANILFMSQVYQSYCYKVEVEHFRRIRMTCNDTYPGFCFFFVLSFFLFSLN